MVKVIGILGSGQLGRMIALAAAELGVRAHIFAPDADQAPQRVMWLMPRQQLPMMMKQRLMPLLRRLMGHI